MTINIYDAEFVQRLFDEMSGTYERVNIITSFGFSRRWRRQFVQQVPISQGAVVCDLLCGMGECWKAVGEQIGATGRIVGIDFSEGMLRGAIRERPRLPQVAIELARLNALNLSLQSESADVVICGFGVKTFSTAQLVQLAAEVRRVLKPGGRFSLVEISVPKRWWLQALYLFYLKQVIPILGWCFLGNPENYRMLGVYTERFQNCRQVAEIFERQGLSTVYHDYFFGCASGVSGCKE